MLSYRHGFHAGNHADVIKHLVEVAIIAKLKQKNKPFVYIDTHSGAGRYDLSDELAKKTNEHETGVTKLENTGLDSELLQIYMQQVQECQQSHGNSMYPGSPQLASQMMREQDKLHLLELHNNEVKNLKRHLGKDPRISIHHRDGFEGLVALLPPMPKRGVVLIDPSYEVKTDYQQVAQTLKKAIKRWPTGIFTVWYPMLAVAKDQSDWLLNQLSQLGVKNLLDVRLTVEGQKQDHGMHGSGMAIINAPWQLDQQMEQALEGLAPVLCGDEGQYTINWVIEPE